MLSDHLPLASDSKVWAFCYTADFSLKKRVIVTINCCQASSKGLLADIPVDISNVLEHRLNIINKHKLRNRIKLSD